MSNSNSNSIAQEHTNNSARSAMQEIQDLPYINTSGRFHHMSGPMKFIFSCYLLAQVLSVAWFVGSTILVTGRWLSWPLLPVVIYLAFLVYFLIAFLKPLPDGLYATKIMVCFSAINILINMAYLVVYSADPVKYPVLGILVMFLFVTVLCLRFLSKDDEVDYLFPKETRKMYVWDYVFVVLQGIAAVLTAILLFIPTNVN